MAGGSESGRDPSSGDPLGTATVRKRKLKEKAVDASLISMTTQFVQALEDRKSARHADIMELEKLKREYFKGSQTEIMELERAKVELEKGKREDFKESDKGRREDNKEAREITRQIGEGFVGALNKIGHGLLKLGEKLG